MQNQINELRARAQSELSAAASAEEVEHLRIRYLARKGEIAALFDRLKSVPAGEKPLLGKALNDLRRSVTELYEQKRDGFAHRPATDGVVDVTLPGRVPFLGTRHPVTQTLDEIKEIFRFMGFRVAEGPEIEDDYHNFGALNFPPDHPARDMQDTFFLRRDTLLRTHTSPVQIRVMEQQAPPVRIIAPGKVYRNEAINPRSYCLFHQVEGLCVDEGVTFSELKGTLIAFIREFFGSKLKYKFRPTFFPFTEPSADIYITCFLCEGSGCRVCKQSGWLEILGCGMVHPHVFEAVGYDPERYTGYAFGLGIERIALLRYGIDDIRLFFDNDIRFLRQF
jgi:phenylalanyl-tRNA synthetase alpha chain